MMTVQSEWHKRKYFFPAKPIPTEPDWSNLRKLEGKKLTPKAQLKLEWIIFYHTLGKRNARQVALHFGITRKTLHKWLRRFNNEYLLGLEEKSRSPLHVRKRQITLNQRIQLKALRTRYPRYGKMKLASIYEKQYGEYLSSWKIQKIIEEEGLYLNKKQASKLRNKQIQARIHRRQRITKFVKEQKINYLWHVDTVILTLPEGGYRYLLTAIDEVSKLAYARLYNTHSSRNSRDFLERLVYLTNNRVVNLHHDNGSEFKKEFEKACRELNIPQWYSRPHTPKDNAVLERFNRTIQEEFIEISDVDYYLTDEFNQKLTDWLIEYNFNRPHKTLDYKTPIRYLDEYYQKVLPMYSSPTNS